MIFPLKPVRAALFVISSAVAAAFPAYGQTPADDFARRQDEKQERQRLDSMRKDTPQDIVPAEKAENIPGGGFCFPVKFVEVAGAHKLSARYIARLMRPYADKCLSLADIHAAVKTLTGAYLDRGYVAARIYIPAQDIKSSRVLRLEVTEGRLSDIYYNGGHLPAYDSRLRSAFPGLKGRALNMRDIEQGLDQMNRLASANAKSALLPGKNAGETVVNITNQPAKPWQVNFSHDNMGQTPTGYARYNAGLALDNLLRANDLWNFSYQRADKDYWGGGSRSREGHSNSYSGSVSLPYGYWTFNFSGYYYDYRSTVPGRFGAIPTSGSSNEARGGVSRLLHRGNNSLTNLNISLAHKATSNFILGEKIETGSRHYTVGTIGLSHSRRMLAGTWTFDASYLQGLDWFGAVKKHELGAGGADPRFGKWTAAVSAVTPFKLGGRDFILNNLVTGQYSPDSLFGAEQLSLGDYYNVRGVRDNLLFGSAGFFTRNDFTWRTAPWRNDALLAGILGEFRPYAGLDFGRVMAKKRDGLTNGHLASWTAGAKLAGGKMSLDAGYSSIFGSTAGKINSGLAFVNIAVSF